MQTKSFPAENIAMISHNLIDSIYYSKILCCAVRLFEGSISHTERKKLKTGKIKFLMTVRIPSGTK